jgi:Tol biopolymer transport system component
MLLILTGACLGGVGCGGTSSSAPPVTGTIAYLRLSSAQMGGQLVVMRVDGSRKRVFRHTFVNTTPVWSRDGSRIAFFSILDKNREHTFVDVVDRNGRGLRLLTPRSWLEDCSWPVWTSDSSTVAFTRNVECDGDIGIYTVRADGTRLRAFFDPIGSDPAWSPDGRTVSYLGGGSALTTLRLMDIDGSKLANTSMDPSWSPDGKWIAFDGTPKGTGGQIWIVNPDGHNLRDLSNDANLPDVNFPPGLDGGGFQCD